MMLECVLVLSVLVFPQYPAMGRILSMPKTKTFEGDIGLTRSQMRSMQTDILFSGKIAPVNKWTNGKVPFTISEKYKSVEKDGIYEAIQEIMGNTCITFVEKKPGDKDFLHFAPPKDTRCRSWVGRRGGRQEVEMSPSCMRHGTIVHELMHALGLYHEQSRPDRDKFILVKWENLKNPQSKVNFEQYNTKFWNDHPLPYDYSSIMHYSGDAFSKEYGLKTIVPKTPNAPMGQRASMSHFDKVKLNVLYNCPEDSLPE